MDIRDEIAARVDKLSPEMQEQVLRFVACLGTAIPEGESGAALRRFAKSVDSASARAMTQAIEEQCERADAGKW